MTGGTAKGEPQKQGLLVILSVSEVSTKLKRGFFATLKMTSGTAQARAHAKRRQKRPLRQAHAKPAHTPFATQIFSSKFTAKRISSTKKERTRDEEITRSHHTRAF